MKAIYINLDPYLQAVADWLNAGKPGTVPHFDPLPLAVTIPLGESACAFAPGGAGAHEGEGACFDVDGNTIVATGTGDFSPGSESAISTNFEPGLSAFGKPTGEGYSQAYSVLPVSGDFTATFILEDADQTYGIPISITVLVRRETASGPVDLVDFTPPAAAPSAADIKSALVAAGNGALEGVKLGGAILIADVGSNPTLINDAETPLQKDNPSDLMIALGNRTAS